MGASSLLPNPPDQPGITDYDREHVAVYLRLLDAEASGADWDAAARLVLEQDVPGDRPAACRMHASHLQRARWLRDHGFLRLLGE